MVFPTFHPPMLVDPKLVDMIVKLAPQTHAGVATMLASRLEKTLEWIIQANMPVLPGKLKDRLFDGYGPLATFSAKIDVAHAFGFIGAGDARLLRAIKEIRNEFAHADEEVHFHHPDIRALVAKLPDRAKMDPYAAYTDAVGECNESLAKRLNSYNEAKLARYELSGAESPDESERRP